MANISSNKKLIEYLRIAKEYKFKKLTLGKINNDEYITDLPKLLFEIESLEELDLRNNHLSFLRADIHKLKNLKILILTGNRLKKLPVAIGKLSNLVSLDLSANELSSLPASIKELSELTRLDISHNQLSLLPSEIGSLVKLRYLNVKDNQLSSIPNETGNLTNLQVLLCGKNRLLQIPDGLRNLEKLEVLSFGGDFAFYEGTSIFSVTDAAFLQLPPELDNNIYLFDFDGKLKNNISELPNEILKLKRLRILDLRDTLLPIPPEILLKISQPKVILDYYFAHLKKPLNELKLIIIGQGSVGKTSIVQQILHGTFDQNQTKTEGISINQWQVEDRHKTSDISKNESEVSDLKSAIKLNIWDFGGQEIMHATHQFFLTKRSLYLLVLDARLTQEENRVEYWLKIIQSFGGESPVLIVGNKTDQHPLDIDRTGLQKKYPNIVGILETSAARGAGIEALKAEIAKHVDTLPHVRDLLPETWFIVKSKLEELAKNKNFFTQDEYLGLCDTNDVKDETSQHTLIGFLHDLGVVLYFQDDPRLEALGILKPQWVTNGVYKILNSHELFQNQGTLTLPMLNKILNLPEYPSNKRLFIVDMMKKFELCYDIEPDKSFLIPDLLPKDEPPELKFTGVPAFDYAYPVLPSSVITRFIVRMNKKIDDGFVWRTGIMLKIGDNTALVKADIEDRKITIAIDGLEHTRRDALSAIRYQLDEIHNSIKGLNPQKRVPIPGAANAEPLEYEYLLMLERDGQEIHLVKDGNRLIKVNIRQVLSGIESETQRKKIGGRVTNIYIGGDVNDSNIVAGDENDLENL